MFFPALPMEFLPKSLNKQDKIKKIWLELQAAEHVLIIGPGLKTIDPSLLPVDCTHLLYIDGGAALKKHQSLSRFSAHSLIIGDKDSCLDPELEFDFLLPTNKDESDLSFALKLLSPKVRKLTLLGFSGGRFDHELSNLGVLDDFINYANSSVESFFHREVTIDQFIKLFSKGHHHFTHQGLFSVFTLKKQLLNISGNVAYPFSSKNPLLPFQSQGLSNVAYGDVIIQSEENFLVIFAEKDQRHQLFTNDK